MLAEMWGQNCLLNFGMERKLGSNGNSKREKCYRFKPFLLLHKLIQSANLNIYLIAEKFNEPNRVVPIQSNVYAWGKNDSLNPVFWDV